MLDLIFFAALLSQEADTGAATNGADLNEAEETAPPVSEVALDFLGQVPQSLENWEPEGFEAQAVSQAFAMLGREDLVQRFNSAAYQYQPCPVIDGDALETMIAAARDAQIVIINEAHDQPFHRHVIGVLGQAISDDFDVFAAETFNYLRLMGERQPGALGWYDREPIFARQITTLEAEGYQFAAYEIRAHQRDSRAETFAERVAVREEAQANNLIAEVLEDDPQARILIHVGYSHVLEAPEPRPDAETLIWFAARLKDKTGIDPLTISQTHCTAVSEPPVPSQQAEGEETPDVSDGEAEPQEPSPESTPVPVELEPGGIVLTAGPASLPEGAVDLFIAHNPPSFTDHRPDWRRAIGDVSVPIPEAYLSADQPVIVEARRPDETLAHTPSDHVLIYPDEVPVLLLPPGEYVLHAWTLEGALGEPETVTVE